MARGEHYHTDEGVGNSLTDTVHHIHQCRYSNGRVISVGEDVAAGGVDFEEDEQEDGETPQGGAAVAEEW